MEWWEDLLAILCGVVLFLCLVFGVESMRQKKYEYVVLFALQFGVYSWITALYLQDVLA